MSLAASHLEHHQTDDDEVLPLTTAAQERGVTREQLWNLVHSGRLQAKRYGQLWFVRVSDLDAIDYATLATTKGAITGTKLVEVSNMVLPLIAERSGITVNDICDHLGRPRRTVLGWLQILEQAGRITRVREGSSRAPARCYLTDLGRKALSQ